MLKPTKRLRKRNRMVDRGESWRNVVITCLVCQQKFGVGVCDRNPIYGGITCPWCGNSTRELESFGTTPAGDVDEEEKDE